MYKIEQTLEGLKADTLRYISSKIHRNYGDGSGKNLRRTFRIYEIYCFKRSCKLYLLINFELKREPFVFIFPLRNDFSLPALSEEEAVDETGGLGLLRLRFLCSGPLFWLSSAGAKFVSISSLSAESPVFESRLVYAAIGIIRVHCRQLHCISLG